MTPRITAADVKLLVTLAPDHILALIEGRKRTFVVDHCPRWSDKWLCTCPVKYRPKDGSDCAHIRATKEATGE